MTRLIFKPYPYRNIFRDLMMGGKIDKQPRTQTEEDPNMEDFELLRLQLQLQDEERQTQIEEQNRIIEQFLRVLDFQHNEGTSVEQNFINFAVQVENLSNDTEFNYVDELGRIYRNVLNDVTGNVENAQKLTADIIYDVILEDFNNFVREIGRDELVRPREGDDDMSL